MYCGEMGRSPFELFADWLSGSQLRGFAQWAEQEVFFTQLWPSGYPPCGRNMEHWQ